MVVFQPHTLKEEVCDGPPTPYLATIGSPHTTDTFYIIVENQLALSCHEFMDALTCLFISYYIFWLDCPTKCECTFKYLQTRVFDRYGAEDGHMQSKLLNLMKKVP